MGMTTSMCVLWGCLVLIDFSFGCDTDTGKALQDGVAEPRSRHRLQLLFPLLLRISTRLATLVPTAIMGLIGIMIFVVFSKKALIISLLALFLSLSGKHGAKNEEVYIHKVESYPDYNDEEHIHYHHHGPPKYKIHHLGSNTKWKKHLKREIPSPHHVPNPNQVHPVKPFKPLKDFRKGVSPGSGANPAEKQNSVFSDAGEWSTPKRQVNPGSPLT